MSSPIPAVRNNSKFDVRPGYFFARTSSVGLPISYPASGSEAIRCGDTEVALIDEIEMSSVTEDGNTNHDVTLKINGIELPFHFPGATDQQHVQRLVWRPKGNLVVHPGQSFTAKAETAPIAHLIVRGRKKSLFAAIRDGDLRGGGRLPNVASTFTVSSSATTNGTARQIVPPIAGMRVEILSMVFTGHNFNAAADNARIGFWDGSTGSFSANGATIMRAWRQGASSRQAQPLLIGNTDGCIQGPPASGVYVSASTNLVGTTQTGDWIIVYRYIPENRGEVASAFGTPGATIAGKSKFWVYTEAAVASATTNSDFTRWFGAQTGSDTLVKVKGWAQSATALPSIGFDVIGFSLGASGTGITPVPPNPHGGLGAYVPLTSDGAGTPAAVGVLHGQDDTLLVCNQSRIPSFMAFQALAGEITNRAQLAWGRFGGDRTLTNQDTSGQSLFTYFV